MNRPRENRIIYKNVEITAIMQAIKYTVTGGLAFGTDFIIFSVLLQEVHYQVANYCGLVAGLLVNYVLSKTWVFQSKKAVDKKEVLTFVGFTAFGFAFTGLSLFIGVDIVKMDEKVTKFIAAVIVFIMNFLARKYVIFKDR